MEFSDYVRVLRRSWLLIVVAALVGGGGATAFALHQTPKYQASSSVLLALRSGSSTGELAGGATYAQQIVATYAEVATKPIVLKPVIQDLGLTMGLDALTREITITSSSSTTILDIAVEDTSARRAAAIATAISTQLQSTVEEVSPTTGAAGTAPVKLTPVESAEVPVKPVSPNVPLTVLIGTLGAAALALAIAILRTALDTRIRRPEDVEAITESPVLGGIAHSSRVKRHPLIVQYEPSGRLAEAFRSLRTNLQFLPFDRESHVMVISSSTEGEGKTTTAVNLALSIADTGSRVLMIDADLRRPRLADYLRVDSGVGLTDVLIGRVGLDDAVQSWGTGALSVLPAGLIPPNPSELLQSTAMEDLLDALQGRFDTIIIDAPPLLPVSDAAILARRAAGTIMICAAGSTTKGQLTEAMGKLEQVGGRVLGVVLTKLPVSGADASHYVKYEYTTKAKPAEPAKARHHERTKLKAREI